MTKRLIALFVLMGALAFAEDKPPMKAAPATMTDSQIKDIIILQQGKQINDLKRQVIDLEEQIRKFQQDATVKAICEDKKIPAEQCQIATDGTNAVTQKPLPPQVQPGK